MSDIKNHASLTTSLVSYWDLEEASGTRYDLHGSNDLDDNNTVTGAVGKVGNASDFDFALSEYLSKADNASLSITGDISISCWVKLTTLPSTSGRMGLVTKSLSTGNQRGYALVLESNDKLRFYAYENGATTEHYISESDAAAVVSGDLGNWLHISATLDVSTQTGVLYVDGSSIAQTPLTNGTLTSIHDSTAAFHVGSYNGASYVDAAMDEVGIWTKVLTSTEVSDLYNSGSGLPYYAPADIKNDTDLSTNLVSYWELEEDTTADRVDSHGANDLTASESIARATGVFGGADYATDFEEGDQEYLEKTSPTGLDGVNELSFSAWVKAETFTDTYPMIGGIFLETGNQRAWCITHVSSIPRWYISDNGGNTGGSDLQSCASTLGALSTATWYHLVGTFQGTNAGGSGDLNIYVNGVLANTVTSTLTSVHASTGAMRLGHVQQFAGNPSIFWDGLIDEVAVYDKELSTTEVRALWGYGTPPVYEAGGAPASTNSNFLAFM